MNRNHSSKGYSFLIRPLIVCLDLGLLILFINLFASEVSNLFFYCYNIFGWIIISAIIGFYNVYRFTSVVKVAGLILKQWVFFIFMLFSFFGILSFRTMETPKLLFYASSVVFSIGVFKFIVYFSLKKYRLSYGGNVRRVLVFGKSKSARELVHFFKSKKNLGYQIRGVFSENSENDLSEGIDFLKNNKIDEVYCSIYETSNPQINKIVDYCESNGVVLKFIPNVRRLPVAKIQTDYYDYTPVFSVPKLALHRSEYIILKRILDIVFSIIVIVGILSWLTPILFVLIKIESKGPLFFIHKRNGTNYKQFKCYKFRSLKNTANIERLHVAEQDERVTKIGRFLRRTSMDELPQFVNVLLGDMSIVGPRPHIPRYTDAYAKKIDKYQFVFRHSVRPGITGLAQVKGFRGEIKSDEDIINRIKYDVFYIENWSFSLDVKIIFDTVLILLKGQDSAY